MRPMTAPQQSDNYQRPPPGMQIAVCSGIVDMGAHFVERSQKYSPKIYIRFHLAALDEEGQHFEIAAFYTYSMYESAHLRKNIESWRGQQFASNDEASCFNLLKIIGQPAYLNVVHNESNGKTYANVQGINPLPPEMVGSVPQIQNPLIINLADLDTNQFERLSVKMQKKIMSCQQWPEIEATLPPGFKERILAGHSQSSQQNNNASRPQTQQANYQAAAPSQPAQVQGNFSQQSNVQAGSPSNNTQPANQQSGQWNDFEDDIPF